MGNALSKACLLPQHLCEASDDFCLWPLSLSEGGGVPDEGGVGAVRPD
jgi:hypothetical protein